MASIRQALINIIASLAHQLGRESAADLCLAYARGQDWIDGVVVGLETEDQLEDNLRLFVKRPLNADECALVEARIPHLPMRFSIRRSGRNERSVPSRRLHGVRLWRGGASRPRDDATRCARRARM